MSGILLACTLNLCMVLTEVCDIRPSSWIFPLSVATLGAIVGSSGVPKYTYQNTLWKRAARYGREGLSIGILTGVVSAILILTYISLADPGLFTETTESLYAVTIGINYLIPSVIGGFVGGEIQSSIRGHLTQST